MNKFYLMIMLVALPSFLMGAAPEGDIYGYSYFFKAPWSTIIQQIENKERNVNDPIPGGPLKRSMLSMAVACGNQAVINKLIQLGADVTGDSFAMHTAIAKIVPAKKSSFRTEGFKRIFEQYFNIITTLVEHGADKTIGQIYIPDINKLPLEYKHRLQQLLDLDPEQRERRRPVYQQPAAPTPYMIKVINFTTSLQANGDIPAQIKKAYNRLVLQHHPDKGGDMEDFKALKAAYEGLMKMHGR